MGEVIGLYGRSGSGKTTTVGDMAKRIKRLTGKRTLYYNPDFGGHASLDPLVKRGIIEVVYLNPDDDVWVWFNNAVSNDPPPDVGLVVFDSFTAIGDLLISDLAKKDAAGMKMGAKAAAPTKMSKDLTLGHNNETHYGLTQTFSVDMLHKFTWLARRSNVDILVTFAEHRGQDPNTQSIIGPKMPGQALTGQLPREVTRMLRLTQLLEAGVAPVHVLVTQAQPELDGTGFCYANPRYPKDATTPLPPLIIPASIDTFFDLIEQAQQEAEQALTDQGF